MTLASEFIGRYAREYDYYDAAARLCANHCERLLKENGIRAIVTYRAKRADRLEAKIEKRALSKNYQVADDIYRDIVDLAGVRVALYFPGDRDSVRNLIETHFQVHQVKDFPEESKFASAIYQRKFSGYAATHFRVTMADDLLQEAQQRYTDVGIEIQVASVLMHAWSEVEHDIIYKPESGPPLEEEYAILDEINGMVLAGEIALQRLQGAVRQRREVADRIFSSSYQLAAYVYEKLRSRATPGTPEVVVGNAGALLDALRQVGLDTPQQVNPFLNQISPDVQDGTASEQLLRLLRRTYSAIQVQEASVEPLATLPIGGKTPYWILPAGNTDVHTALESLHLWLDQGMWGMRRSTPGRKHLRIGDQVGFYAAKVGVVAVAEIAGGCNQFVAAVDAPETIDDETVYRVPLQNIRWLPEPIPLDRNLRVQLDAFKGRNPEGIWAWFIQSTRNVTEHDFHLLTGTNSNR